MPCQKWNRAGSGLLRSAVGAQELRRGTAIELLAAAVERGHADEYLRAAGDVLGEAPEYGFGHFQTSFHLLLLPTEVGCVRVTLSGRQF